jgi:hypothetical protein
MVFVKHLAFLQTNLAKIKTLAANAHNHLRHAEDIPEYERKLSLLSELVDISSDVGFIWFSSRIVFLKFLLSVKTSSNCKASCSCCT